MDAAPDLLSLRIVRAIAEYGTISESARMLGYSQPALSQHLSRTQARLGLALVIRSGRGVRLTEAGLALASHAVTILTAVDAASAELADLAGLSAGTVRIAAFPTASSTLVPRLIRQLRKQHPQLTVNYVEAEPPQAMQLLRDGATDLAITFSYPGDRADPHLSRDGAHSSTPLFTEPVVLVLPRSHRLATNATIKLADLADDPWIAGCTLCRGHLLALCDSEGFAPEIGLETDNALAVLSFVSRGLGVALLPQLALSSLTLPEGVSIHAPQPSSERTIQYVTAPGATRIPSVATAITALRELGGGVWGLRDYPASERTAP
ncbi:MAG: LysR family transcriptional regulator [Rhodoglobus sp.]